MLSSSVKKKLMIWDKDDHFQLFTLASTPAQVTKTRWKQTRQSGTLVNIFSRKATLELVLSVRASAKLV